MKRFCLIPPAQLHFPHLHIAAKGTRTVHTKHEIRERSSTQDPAWKFECFSPQMQRLLPICICFISVNIAATLTLPFALADPDLDCGCYQCDCCPPGQYNSAYKKCGCCPSGTYMDHCNYGPPCMSCPSGHFCPVKSANPSPCAAGTFNPNGNSGDASDCQQCTANSYCPQASAQPTACPDGLSSDAGAQSLDDCRVM